MRLTSPLKRGEYKKGGLSVLTTSGKECKVPEVDKRMGYKIFINRFFQLL